jgi:hypothetical protein
MPDIARFKLKLTTAEGTPAEEPNCYVGFMRTDSTTALEAKNIAYPPDHTFRLPAWPQEQNLYCLIKPTLYQVVQSGFFRPSGDQEQAATLVRLPDQWTPEFQPLANLPASRFDFFQKLLAKSPDVDVKHGPQLGNLADAFDSLKGTQQILAKMALLNLYAVLSDETEPIDNTHWIHFVQQIVRIDQERFVAETDPDLFDLVQRILSNLGNFKGFFTEASPNLHLENIPPAYQLTGDLITVKVRYEQGNVQFTMGKATKAGQNVVLLDCDMDEHSNLIEHTGDLFTHVFTGGTHPIDMHEYIVHHDPGVQLGYDLAPVEAAVAAAAAGAGR